MICVLMLAAGAAWESRAMAALDGDHRVVLLKRCVDVDDLLAAATSGQAQAAVIDLEAPGLDPAAVTHLRRHGVRPVAVTATPAGVGDAERAARLSITATVTDADLTDLPQAVASAEDMPDTSPRSAEVLGVSSTPARVPEPEAQHRVVAVWGAGGAPGRTTVAVNLAAELARRSRPVLLVDADPWGGHVAQHLGILDEVSGMLSAARLAGAGQLREQFASICRGVGEHLVVVTGLPRADRWREVRPAVLEQVLEVGADRHDVVVDTGFTLEGDPSADFGGRPARNGLTTTALDRADEIVVVGAADPVGLSRLARGLVELRERGTQAPVRVVVNRMRGSLGWSEREVAGLVEGFVGTAGLHFAPDDRSALDQALVAGRALVETHDSALARSLAALTDALAPDSVVPRPARRMLRRTRH